MRSKTLVVVIAFAVMGVSSTAMAKGSGGGGGGAGGKGGSAVGHFGHGHFGNHIHFRRNQAFLGGWGWGGWGPYGEGNNTTVVAFPQATPRAAEVTGSITPCHLSAETFTVPSSAGETRPVQVVSCR
jgi:hypothetical protein